MIEYDREFMGTSLSPFIDGVMEDEKEVCSFRHFSKKRQKQIVELAQDAAIRAGLGLR